LLQSINTCAFPMTGSDEPKLNMEPKLNIYQSFMDAKSERAAALFIQYWLNANRTKR